MEIIIDLKDPVFEDKYSESYFLILSHYQSLINIIEYYPEFNKFISLKQIKSKNKGFVSMDQLLEASYIKPLKYRKKLLCVNHKKFTLIPEDFTSNIDIENLFKLNFKKANSELICNNIIKELALNLTYSLSADLQKFSKGFEPTQSYHGSTTFLYAILQTLNKENNRNIFININPDFVQIAYFNFEQLVFFNAFKISAKEDLLYHLLNVSKQLGIDPEKDEYFISGSVLKDDEQYKLIQEYFRYPIISNKTPFFSFSKEFENTPVHQFLTDFATILCV